MSPKPSSAATPGSMRLQLTKLVVLAGLTFLVVGVPILLVSMGGVWLEPALSSAWWLVPAAVLALLSAAAPLAYLGIVRRIEGRVFRDQRRYHTTLISASRGMIRIKDIRTLCRLIVHVVNRTVQLTHTGLFLFDPIANRYFLSAVRHKSMMPVELTVESDDPLIEVVQARKDLVILEELEQEIRSQHDDEKKRKLTSVHAWMRKLETRLIVPSFSNDRLLAFFVLGAKRNRQPYTTDDISIFAGLANQAALAIENAMFFEELRNNEAYMIQSEKLASLGQLASGMAHEIHNPLSIISGEAQLYLERSRGQDAKVDEVLTSIIEECQRAADITRRILRFAKPAPNDLVPLDLKTVVEESMALAAYQVRLERVERVVNFPEELPKVKGNQNQLQEVFLNLILNACQAMGEKGGTLTLSAVASGTHVELQIVDNGPGISAEKLNKVFDPFFTTKSTGTGLGLFVSQRIIRLHEGTMSVESTEGEGTRFTILLPMYQEEATAAAGVS